MRYSPAAAVVSVALLTGSVALADTSREVNGTLTRFDSATHTLVVKEMAAPRKELQLSLADAAQITRAGKTASASDLKPGERVKVMYTDQGATHQATRVDILAAKTGKG